MENDYIGAILQTGPSDWQILQQDEKGFAEVALGGKWFGEASGKVEVRLVLQDTGVAVSPSLDWKPAYTYEDGTWALRLTEIPAGGLYRLETRFNPDDNIAGEWSKRGDMRHFLGVGDLWVIAGQSNSVGYGRGPVYDPPELGIHLFRNDESWSLATHPMNDSTDTRHITNREAFNSGHSPYLNFARILNRRLNHPIGLVQTALGGSPLFAWSPEDSGHSQLYENMLQCIDKAGGKIKGILWYQGESDANGDNALTYGERFAAAVESWRAALKMPDLPILTGQLNRYHQMPTMDDDRSWSLVREAQRQAPQRIGGVFVVPTLDLPLCDTIHVSPSGNMLLGERMARCALGGVYGGLVDFLAPDLVAAAATADGMGVDLTFSPVTSRMDCVDPTAIGFTVEDESGMAVVEKVVYPGDNRVRVILGRKLDGKAVVHGGYGMNPDTVPMDLERFMPILGFYGAEIR